MSSKASSYPFFTCSPSEAYRPVIGTTAPILIVFGAGPEAVPLRIPQPISTSEATAISTRPRTTISLRGCAILNLLITPTLGFAARWTSLRFDRCPRPVALADQCLINPAPARLYACLPIDGHIGHTDDA